MIPSNLTEKFNKIIRDMYTGTRLVDTRRNGGLYIEFKARFRMHCVDWYEYDDDKMNYDLSLISEADVDRGWSNYVNDNWMD